VDEEGGERMGAGRAEESECACDEKRMHVVVVCV
jgi:hypothetical protein